MFSKVIFAVVAAVFLSKVSAECPNACSANGKCGAYDMCICYRNWMANDCSERICQFGLAHVDTPKGDLDASSGKLAGPGTKVVLNDAVYPYGTTEQFPAMENSDGTVLTNTAHYYMECSNKGMCDRSSGTCACFEGYGGSACQRAECPSSADGMCSGHGVCEDIKKIAANDHGNVYKLWDEHSTMGCVCDSGYEGTDCSSRSCKTGFDPLYYDDYQNVRYSNWTFQIYTKEGTTADNLDSTNSHVRMYGSNTATGNYSLIFYDATGEDWETSPISIEANCDGVIEALEGIPNNVIPWNSVNCFQHDMAAVGKHTDDSGAWYGGGGVTGASGQEPYLPIFDSGMNVKTKFTISFPMNPGKLKQIKINKYLDGTRPTLFSTESTSTLNWNIYPNGFTGEDTDYVNDECEGVLVTLTRGVNFHTLTGIDVQEMKALKRCLGDSNGVSTDNVDVYNWDHGTQNNPHLIKLVDATQDDSVMNNEPATQLCNTRTSTVDLTQGAGGNYESGYCSGKNPPGFYTVIWYDSSANAPHGEFRTITPVAQNFRSATQFHVYTTTGYLQQVNEESIAFTSTWAMTPAEKIASYHTNVIHLSNYSHAARPGSQALRTNFFGQLDCETNPAGMNGALECLNKDDKIMIFQVGTISDNAFGGMTAADFHMNPTYPNIYTVKKIGRELNVDTSMSEDQRQQIVLDMNVNFDYRYKGDDTAHTGDGNYATVYKFIPGISKYNYAAQCSNRGLCNTDSGTCECFNGYTNDNCDTQNSLAL
jgi:hypothetical protein